LCRIPSFPHHEIISVSAISLQPLLFAPVGRFVRQLPLARSLEFWIIQTISGFEGFLDRFLGSHLYLLDLRLFGAIAISRM